MRRQHPDENARLRQAFDRLPKTDHAKDVFERHPEVLPEWIMRIIEYPYDEWTETDARGRSSRVLAGRVASASQWIKVILNPQGQLVTAHFDHHLEDRGRPIWRTTMAAKPVKSESDLPNITVTYDADADVLFITNGDDTAFGDSIANGVAMFYDQDPGSAGALAGGMHIIGAQGALKPFVDAILRQHGIEPSQQGVFWETVTEV